MKFINIIAIILVVIPCLKPIETQSRILTSFECNNQGTYYDRECICFSGWEGKECRKKVNHKFRDNTTTTCDDLTSRLDDLSNISPKNYHGDDPEFSRLKGKMAIQYKWKRIHDILPNFKIFGSKISFKDLKQGETPNCYLIAALASLASVNEGKYIRDMFLTTEDNENRVYCTKWIIEGKPRVVCVDEWVPIDEKGDFKFAKTSTGVAWPTILEKSYSKIHKSYDKAAWGSSDNVWKYITSGPKGNKFHTQINVKDLYNLVKSKFKSGCPISGSAYTDRASNLIKNHAYSVIGIDEVRERIRMYNPAGSETWTKNPNYDNTNDGAFYLSAEDYHKNFILTLYNEARDGYVIKSQIVPLRFNKRKYIWYSAKFDVKGAKNRPIFISVDEMDPKMFGDCKIPFKVKKHKYDGPSGSYQTWNIYDMEVKNTIDGTYTMSGLIRVNNFNHKFASFVVYAPPGVVTFQKRALGDRFIEKDCLIKCPINGYCNTFDGKCHCYPDFSGDNCSIKKEVCIDISMKCNKSRFFCALPKSKMNCAKTCGYCE